MRFVIQDAQGERCVDIDGDVIKIGRGASCHITVHDDRASREHCEVRKKDDQILVVDLKSRNGTQVNGATVSERALCLGDCIEIGKASVRLEASSLAGAPPPAPPPPAPQPPKERCQIVFQEGERKGQTLVLDMLSATLGRSKSNTIHFNDDKLSLRHAEIFLDVATHRYLLRDHKSTNGTKLNGEKVTDAPLENGAVIEMGAQRLLFVDQKGGVPAARFSTTAPTKSRAEADTPAGGKRRLPVRGVLVAAFGIAVIFGVSFAWRKMKSAGEPHGVVDLSPPTGSLIARNHSFEEGGAKGEIPGWKVLACGDASVSRDAPFPPHGAHALRLAASGPGSADAVIAVEYDETFRIERGYVYAASAMVRAHGCRGLVGLRAAWSADGKAVGESYSPLLTGNEEWGLVKADFLPPRGAKQLRLACVALGRFGEAGFDDVRLLRRPAADSDRPMPARLGEWDLELDERACFHLTASGEGAHAEAVREGGLSLWAERRRASQVQLLPEKGSPVRSAKGVEARGKVVDLDTGKAVPVTLTASLSPERAILAYVAEVPEELSSLRVGLSARLAGGLSALSLDGGETHLADGVAEGVTRVEWSAGGPSIAFGFKVPVRVTAEEDAGEVELACIAPERAATMTVTIEGVASAAGAASWLLARAQAADAKGAPGEALSAYREVVAKFPTSEAALAFARPRVVQIEADAEGRLAELTASLEGTKDLARAKAKLEEIARLFPRSEWEQRGKEAILAAQGTPPLEGAAKEEAEKLLASAEQAVHEEKWLFAEVCAQNLQRKYAGTPYATKGDEMLARAQTGYVEATLKKARELVAAKHPEQAKPLYEDILSRYPLHPQAEQARKELSALH